MDIRDSRNMEIPDIIWNIHSNFLKLKIFKEKKIQCHIDKYRWSYKSHVRPWSKKSLIPYPETYQLWCPNRFGRGCEEIEKLTIFYCQLFCAPEYMMVTNSLKFIGQGGKCLTWPQDKIFGNLFKNCLLLSFHIKAMHLLSEYYFLKALNNTHLL